MKRVYRVIVFVNFHQVKAESIKTLYNLFGRDSMTSELWIVPGCVRNFIVINCVLVFSGCLV